MKTLYKCFLTVFIFCVTNHSFAQTNIFPSTGAAGIGTTTPDASSLLEIKSTSKGILIPRMTAAQRIAIVAPATGLLIYQTNSLPGFYYYNGSVWTAISVKGANTTLSNLAAPTAVNVDLLAGTANTINLGSASNSWKDIYLDGSVYLGGSRFLSYIAGTGTGNTVVGASVLNSNTTGINNTGVGFNALFSNTTGKYNTANGYQALQYNSIGGNNTATGYKALQNNTTGSGNVANGLYALINNTTGYSNVAIGERVLASNTAGHNLVAVGDSALFHQGVNSNDYYSNTAIGSKTLYSNTIGYRNTANGAYALYYNTTGHSNTANGDAVLYYNTKGYNNTANGDGALFSNTIGDDNTANGVQALYYNTLGYNNTANGEGALFSNITGSNNTAIGFFANVSSGNYSNSTALGYGASITASNQVRIGNSDITSIGGYTGWTIISDGRVNKNIKGNVPGLAFINLLKPITYNLDLDAADKIIQRPAIKDKDGKTIQPTQENITARQIQQQVICTGFIAQEVEASAKKIGYDFDGVDAARNDKDLYGLRYSEFVVPLVKAVQELSIMNDKKGAKIDSLQKQVDGQQKINNDLQKQNEEIQKQVADLKTLVLQIQQTQQQCSPCSAITSSIQQNNITLINTASLEQNVPNPFTNTTTIAYFLPSKFSSAKIIITDKNGKQLKQINLSGAGKGSLKVDASTLSSGAYQYSLFVDGRLIDTKQMELLK